jgi:hypothetical protein
MAVEVLSTIEVLSAIMEEVLSDIIMEELSAIMVLSDIMAEEVAAPQPELPQPDDSWDMAPHPELPQPESIDILDMSAEEPQSPEEHPELDPEDP